MCVGMFLYVSIAIVRQSAFLPVFIWPLFCLLVCLPLQFDYYYELLKKIEES